MEKENLELLNKIHKGLVMGMESISVITPKVGDRNFRDDLNYQYNEYGKVLDKIDAKFDNGMLKITVPKKEEVDTKKVIEIQ